MLKSGVNVGMLVGVGLLVELGRLVGTVVKIFQAIITL